MDNSLLLCVGPIQVACFQAVLDITTSPQNGLRAHQVVTRQIFAIASKAVFNFLAWHLLRLRCVAQSKKALGHVLDVTQVLKGTLG